MHVPSALIESLAIIEQWTVADRESDKTNPFTDDLFPTLIRAPGTEFGCVDRPAVLTQQGCDKLLQAYENSKNDANPVGLSPDKFTNAFVTNVDANAKPIIPGLTCEVLGVELTLTPIKVDYDDVNEKAQQSNIKPRAYDISYTESITSRYSEARRFTPFTLISTYLTWIKTLLLQHPLPTNPSTDDHIARWEAMTKQGAHHLLTGILYVACEFLCARTSGRDGKANASIDGRAILLAFRNNKPDLKLSGWMTQWRKPMNYSYVTAQDVGYPEASLPKGQSLDEYFKAKLDAPITRGNKAGVGVKTQVDRTKMPFVETKGGGHPLQPSALTTMASLRFWLCLSMAIETCGSMHLPGFDKYYTGVLTFFGKNPGRVGRKLAKHSVKFARLLSADLLIDCPESLVEPNGLAYMPKVNKRQRFTDAYAMEILAHNAGLSKDASKMAIASKIAEDIPEVKTGLLAIIDEFMSETGRRKHAVSLFSNTYLDAITHLSSAGSAEGYARSCLASLPVSGYSSKTQRKIIQELDVSRRTRAVDEVERSMINDIVDQVSIPTFDTIYQQMRTLSNSKSGGGDRVRARINRGIVLQRGQRSDDVVDGISSNRKDIMHLTAGQLLSYEYLTIQAPINAPFPIGLRSVPARKLRYIYNLPITHQIVLSPLYHAMKAYMKEELNGGFALAQKKGIPFYDDHKEINASILLTKDANLLCAAHDASSLDQHIDENHRRELVEAIIANISTPEDDPLFKFLTESEGNKTGQRVTYASLAKMVLECWDDSYYKVLIPGAPEQRLHVDTQPSGALTTANDNSIVMMSLMRMIGEKSGRPFSLEQVWGDDFYGLVNIDSTHDSAVEVLSHQESMAMESGQILGTVKDSSSGRVVHFLQKLYICGQQVRRRMAYDHENEVGTEMVPGEIGEYLDKARDLATRGGNRTLLNMLQIVTLVNGARSTVYGRQGLTDFDSMAAPGGLLNRVLVGFHPSKSQLYLELNSEDIFGAENIEIGTRVTLDTPMEIGERALSYIDTQSETVSYQIGGKIRQDLYKNLQETATDKLIDNNRVLRSISSTAQSALEASGLTKYEYRNSVRRGAQMAIGGALRDGHLLKPFREKAMLKAGIISNDITNNERKLTTSTSHDGIRIRDFKYTYSMSNDHFIVLPDPKSEIASGKMFKVISHGVTSASIAPKWHPYYYLPSNLRYLLALLGMQAGSTPLSAKTFVSQFSPGEFRTDMTAEEVMNALKKLDSTHREPFLRYIGFDEHKAATLVGKVAQIPLYQDLSTATEYTSLPDVLKSCSAIVIDELIQITSPAVYTNVIRHDDSDDKSVIRQHFASLIADELNIISSLDRPDAEHVKFLRLPIVEQTSI
jgi:hypothetical protein